MLHATAEKCRDSLGDRFRAATINNVADEMDPTFPRLIFPSVHGFSTIVVSASTVGLVIRYSPDWQTDDEAVRLDHLNSSAAILTKLLKVLGVSRVNYLGLILTIERTWSGSDADLVSYLSSKILSTESRTDIYDISTRLTRILGHRWYSNTTVENYRFWGEDPQLAFAIRLSNAAAQTRGVRVHYDLNDRFAFNETKGYSSNVEETSSHIGDAFKRAKTTVRWICGNEPQ